MLQFSDQELLMLLRPPAFSDVTSNFRCAYDFALAISNGRHSKRNVNEATMFAPPNGFKVLNALPAPDTLQNCCFLVESVLWNHHRNWLTDGFIGGIAKQPLCPPVPTSDNAI